MCTKKEVRPGLDGIVDYVDVIEEVESKLSPILTLLKFTTEINPLVGEVLTKDEISNLGWLLQDMLDEVWSASEGIYELYRKEVE